MKTITNSIYAAFGLFAFICFTAPGTTQAVNPPPDGCYPNFTTAEGCDALNSLTTGAANTAVGWSSLKSVTTGGFNTGVGAGALLLNNGDNNTATGAAALLLNATGADNTANGTAALVDNSTGSANTAIGAFALNNNTADANTAVGHWAALGNTSGTANTVVGASALRDNMEGNENTALGLWAGLGIQGSRNTAVGTSTLRDTVQGNDNTAVGRWAGLALTGSNNICIGSGVLGVAGESNAIRIGDNLTGGFCFIGNIWNVGPGVPNTPVIVSNTGRLGVNTSSRRFKRDIIPMGEASEAILALKPMTFHYKDDAKNTPCFGLIAEEVAEIDPTLVIRDEKGQPFTVRYEQINAMLLNEFLKEHRKVEKQQATIAELKSTVAQQQKRFADQEKQIAALTSGLQKVSAQIEMSRPTAQIAVNEP
jgi:uncharacterized coiled-coil protein SlyX